MGVLTITAKDNVQWKKFLEVTIKKEKNFFFISYHTIPSKNVAF